MCAFFCLSLFARRTGLIITMAAPVVPTHDAKAVPMSSMMEFTSGVPFSVPVTTIPPEIVKRAHRRMMNGM